MSFVSFLSLQLALLRCMIHIFHRVDGQKNSHTKELSVPTRTQKIERSGNEEFKNLVFEAREFLRGEGQ